MRTLLITMLALMMIGLSFGTARADTTYRFSWDHGETTFFRFANNEWLAESTPPDSWDQDVDGSGNLTTFDTPSPQAHSTALSVSGVTVKAKFVIEDVTGSVNIGAFTSSWTFTGHVNFSASGVFSEGQCRTSSFTVSFSGNYDSGTDSSAFTIPSLSGSGSQLCGGASGTVNSHFSLGSSGGRLHFNKFSVTAI